jgi:hypothetical protein
LPATIDVTGSDEFLVVLAVSNRASTSRNVRAPTPTSAWLTSICSCRVRGSQDTEIRRGYQLLWGYLDWGETMRKIVAHSVSAARPASFSRDRQVLMATTLLFRVEASHETASAAAVIRCAGELRRREL